MVTGGLACIVGCPAGCPSPAWRQAATAPPAITAPCSRCDRLVNAFIVTSSSSTLASAGSLALAQRSWGPLLRDAPPPPPFPFPFLRDPADPADPAEAPSPAGSQDEAPVPPPCGALPARWPARVPDQHGRPARRPQYWPPCGRSRHRPARRRQ